MGEGIDEGYDRYEPSCSEALPQQKQMTQEQLENFVEYVFNFDALLETLFDKGDSPIIIAPESFRQVVVDHLCPVEIVDWIRDHLGPQEIWSDEAFTEMAIEHLRDGGGWEP